MNNDQQQKNMNNDQQQKNGDRSPSTFGRTELYLLLLLFMGGLAIDFAFKHHSQQPRQQPTEQPTSLNPAAPKPLL